MDRWLVIYFLLIFIERLMIWFTFNCTVFISGFVNWTQNAIRPFPVILSGLKSSFAVKTIWTRLFWQSQIYQEGHNLIMTWKSWRKPDRVSTSTYVSAMPRFYSCRYYEMSIPELHNKELAHVFAIGLWSCDLIIEKRQVAVL